jgi:hypothetical protein
LPALHEGEEVMSEKQGPAPELEKLAHDIEMLQPPDKLLVASALWAEGRRAIALNVARKAVAEMTMMELFPPRKP